MAISTRDKLHVLHVVPGLVPGGMELTLARLLRGLEGSGIRHTVLCLTGEPLLAEQFPASTPIHCLRCRPNDPGLPWQLWRLLRRLRPTVIHARNWGAWPDVALARLLVWPSVPLIFSFHGFASIDPLPRRRRWAFRGLSRMTTHLLTVCEAARCMLIEELGWPSQKVRVIPNGVDTARFSPRAEEKAASDRLVVGCVGSLTMVKNHALLVRAFSALVQAGIDCELRLAGEGPERAKLQRLAEEFGVAPRVSFAGHVQDVPAFLRQLDVFALPSSSEAHPNALLEAMACGLPCVATNVGGVPEVLDSGRFGRLVPPGDPHELAGALRDLCLSAEARRTLGAAARRRVTEKYSMHAMIAAYTRLYCEASARAYGRSTAGRDRKRREWDRPSVLMLGPLPPLTGGMATVARNLRDSELSRWCRLQALNNGKTTSQRRRLVVGVWAQIRLLGRVTAAVLRRRVRLVHIHTCALFSFWRDIVHMMAVRLLGCRVVWHLHDGSFLGFISQGSRIKRAAIRWTLRRGAAVIVLSEEARDRLRPFAPGVTWRVVPNGVPLPTAQHVLPSPLVGEGPGVRGLCNQDAKLSFDGRLAEPSDRISDGSLKLLFLGNLTHRKGAYDLIAAVEAAARHGVRPVLLLAGGEVAAGQREAIEKRIAASPCQDQIRLLGLIDGDDKQRAIRQADCIVLPSYAEGLPMALLEGMAAGMPAVATRIGSIPAVVEDGVEGFLIEPGDVAALAERICRLAGDAQLRCRMAQAARNRVQEQFSINAMAERVYQIYLEALAGNRKKAQDEEKR